LPTFEISIPDLRSAGPVVPLHIGPSRELIAVFGADGVAAPISVNALVDTGASSTVITPEIVAHLLNRRGLQELFAAAAARPFDPLQFPGNVWHAERVYR
jgi:hypothetical protein